MYDKLNVEYGIVLPEVNPEGCRFISTNEEIMAVVAKYPNRFGWFMNIDPRAMYNNDKNDFSMLLDFYMSHGAKGIGEISANIYFDDPRAMNLFAQAEERGLPIIFHIGVMGNDYGLVDDLGLPRLEKVLKTFPKLKVLGHSQKFWSEISADVTEETRNTYPTGKVIPGRLIEMLENCPNLCCDISAGSGLNALTRDEEFGCAFIEKYQDRIYYGTDICSPNNVVRHGEWLDSMMLQGKISETAYRKVCRENAIKLLDLKL